MDLERLLDSRAQAATARAVEAALLADGYLVLTGPRLGAVAAALAGWTRFGALPMEVRRRFHISVTEGDRHGGWMLMREHPVYMSHMAEHELAAAEPKQEYGFGIDTDRTLWPDDTVAPGFARDARAAAALLDDIARTLLAAFEAMLGEAPGFLRYRPGYLALKTYPGRPNVGGEADQGLHEHSDAVAFTMLAQSRKSLQIRGRDGGWSTAPADPGGALLVIPGDWMELFTNGRIPAVRHRVMDTEVSRCSLAFFQNLAPMPVGPLARFLGPGEAPRYPTVASDIPYTNGGSGVPRWQTAPEARAFAAAHVSS